MQNNKIQYLVNIKNKGKVHIWNGKDTECRMYTTGGLHKDSYTLSDDSGGRETCKCCLNMLQKIDTKKEKKRKKELAKLEKIRAYKEKFGITEELTQAQCIAVLNGSKRRPSGRKKPLTKKQKRNLRRKEGFYESREWLELRYEALKKYGRQCVCCGQKPPQVVLHVDHIKPRSKFPELELELDNLQIMCKDCNLGKSNTDCIDYR